MKKNHEGLDSFDFDGEIGITDPFEQGAQEEAFQQTELSDSENSVMFIFTSLKVALDMRHN